MKEWIKKTFFQTWEERYLSQATDHSDLERRLKCLDRNERKESMFVNCYYGG